MRRVAARASANLLLSLSKRKRSARWSSSAVNNSVAERIASLLTSKTIRQRWTSPENSMGLPNEGSQAIPLRTVWRLIGGALDNYTEDRTTLEPNGSFFLSSVYSQTEEGLAGSSVRLRDGGRSRLYRILEPLHTSGTP